jgi:arylsulfatase
MQWIAAVKGQKPFFCYVATNAPHGPLDCPPEYEKLYADKVAPAEAKFFGMIANIDDNVERLLSKLQEWNLEQQTLVIFMNDNGGTQGVRIFNAGLHGGKGTPWQGGTRAASFWRWPGTLVPADVGALTAHVDVFPTLVELAGATLNEQVKAQVEGRSLVPLLANPTAAWSDRYLVTHVGRWGKGEAPVKEGPCSIRNSRYSLVHAGKDWQLFNLQNDPGETKDVAAASPDVVKELRTAYDQWWQEILPCLVNEDAVGPALNPFKEQYWRQFGGGPDEALLRQMDPKAPRPKATTKKGRQA